MGYCVIVENLSSKVTWQVLKDHMRRAGSVVTYVEAHNPNRHEGCVEFASEKDARTALDNLNGSLLYGRRIKLIDESQQGVFSRSLFHESINQIRSYLYGAPQQKRRNLRLCKSILY